MIIKNIRIEKAQKLTSKEVLKYALRYMKQDGEIFVSCAKRGNGHCSLGDSLSVKEIGIEDNDLITLAVKGDNEQEHFDELVKLIGGTIVESTQVKSGVKEKTKAVTLYEAGLKPGSFFFDEQELYILMEARQLVNSKGSKDWVATAYRPKTDSIHVFTIWPGKVMVEDLGEYKTVKYLYESLDGYVFEDEAGASYTITNKVFKVMMNQVKKDSNVTLVFYNNEPVFVYSDQPINKTWFVVDDVEINSAGVYVVATVMNGEVRDGMTFMALDDKNHLYTFDLVLFNHYKYDDKVKFIMYPNMNEETYYDMANKYPMDIVKKGFVFEHYHGLHNRRSLNEHKIADLEMKILEKGLTDELVKKLAYSAKMRNKNGLAFEKYDNYFKEEYYRISAGIERQPKGHLPATIKFYQTRVIAYTVATLFLLLFPGVRDFFDGSWLCFIAWIGIVVFGYFKKKIIGALIALVSTVFYIQLINVVFPTDYSAYFALIAAFIYKAQLNFKEWNKAKLDFGYYDRKSTVLKSDVVRLQKEVNQFSQFIQEKKKQCERNQLQYFQSDSKHALHLGITDATKANKAYTRNMEIYHCVNYLYYYYTNDAVKTISYVGQGLK